MANKYNNAYAVLLNNGDSQILPVSKAQLIELAYEYQNGQFGTNAKDVSAALAYLLAKGNTDLDAAKAYTGEQIAGLNSSISVETGYVFGGTITQEGGKLVESSYSVWLDASVVSYQGGDGENDPHTVQAAIENIQTTLSSLAGDGEGSVQTQITNAINKLDVDEISDEGKPIVAVSETNGYISASAGNIDSAYVTVSNEDNKFHIAGDSPAATLTTQETLEQLQSEIDSRDARYELVTDDTNKPENVLHRYKLSETVNGVTTYVGSSIDIPKDQSLVSVFLGTSNDTVNSTTGAITYVPAEGSRDAADIQSMNFIYQLANGTYTMTNVDVSYFLNEAEFDTAAGLNLNNHVVSVKTGDGIAFDSNGAVIADVKSGDNYIEIDSNGKIASKGIDSAISTAIENINTTIEKKVENNYTYVLAEIAQTNGEITATENSYVALSDENIKTTYFATGEGMRNLLGDSANSVTDVHAALNAIAGQVNDLGGGAVTTIDTVNTQKEYVTVSAEKSGTTYTLTVDDSKLGNVALLNYDQLAELGENEMITILDANPTV